MRVRVRNSDATEEGKQEELNHEPSQGKCVACGEIE